MNLNLDLVRHGATSWNKDGRFQGHLPGIGLSPEGRETTAALGISLSSRNYTTIVSSPQQRAYDTAIILKTHLRRDTPIIKDERFAEWNIPIWEGLTTKEIIKHFPKAYKAYLMDPAQLRLDGAETLSRVQERTLAGIKYLQERYAGGRVLLVTHSAVIKVILCGLLEIPLSSYHRFYIANSTLTAIKISHHPILRLFNWYPKVLDAEYVSVQEVKKPMGESN